MGWRYLAYRLNGDGTQTLLNPELPLDDVKFKPVLSGPGSMTAKISPVDPGLVGPDGEPVLREWSTVIYPEADDQIRGGFILTEAPELEGPDLAIKAASFTAYPKGQPHVGSWQTSGDVLDVVREAWDHLQSQAGGDLGMIVDNTEAGVDPGTPAEPAVEQVKVKNTWIDKSQAPAGSIVDEINATLTAPLEPNDTLLRFEETGRFDGVKVPFEIVIQGEHIMVGARYSNSLGALRRGYGTKKNDHGAGAKITREGTPQRVKPAKGYIPKRLNWWETADLGKEIDDAMLLSGLDYRERHWWFGQEIKHRLEIGNIGRRLHELRFAVGENVVGQPKLTGGPDDYATETLILGSGEGPTMKRGRAYRSARGLRRVAVLADKSIGSDSLATKVAKAELSYRTGEYELSSITVIDHPNAPLGSFDLGDEIAVQVYGDWATEATYWVRIVAIEFSPESPSVATLSVIPA